jgi:hypothetical protein
MPTISPAHKAIEHYYADLRAYAAQGVIPCRVAPL